MSLVSIRPDTIGKGIEGCPDTESVAVSCLSQIEHSAHVLFLTIPIPILIFDIRPYTHHLKRTAPCYCINHCQGSFRQSRC